LKDFLKMFSLEGKKAVVTGGAGILGSAIVRGFGRAGAEVAVCDIKDTNKAVGSLKREGVKVKGYYLDVMDIEKIRDCYNEILKDFGRIDILVNAAGGNIKEATTSDKISFFDLPLSALEKIVGLNLFGAAILPAQVFGRGMVDNKEGGSIINISSMSALRPLTRTSSYSSAKASLSNFTQWLAVHFAQEYNEKLRVNAIAPGFLLTNQNRYLLLNNKENLTPRAKSIISHTPMGKFGDPDDLIGTCIWLASDASKFVTGIVVPIDGGFSAFSGV